MTTHEPLTRTGTLGIVETRILTVIAAERDGEPLTDEIGRRTLELECRFAWRDDCETWAAGLRCDGFEIDGPTPIACNYHGATDSPSNCWTIRGRRPLALGKAPSWTTI